MWSVQVVTYYVAPVTVAGCGFFVLYRSTELEGGVATRAFFLGVLLVLSAWGFTAARSSIANRRLAAELHELRQHVQEFRSAVGARTAAEIFVAAMEHADEHRQKSWVHFPRD